MTLYILGMVQNPAIEVLQREREALNERAKELRAKIKAIDEAIRQLLGDDAPEPAKRSSGPKLNDLILAMLRVEDVGYTPQEIAENLTNDGRETGNTTVSSLLSRLNKSGDVERRDGKWYLKRSEPPEGGPESVGEAGAEAATSEGSNPSSSKPRKGSLLGGTSLSTTGPVLVPRVWEKGG